MTGGRLPAGGVQVLPVGDQGLLLEVADLGEVLALSDTLRRLVATGAVPWAAVTDVVPAARTVLLLTRDGSDLAALRTAVAATFADASPAAPAASAAAAADDAANSSDSVRLAYGSEGGTTPETAPKSHEVEIAVRYDGPDLDDVARLTGLSPAEVVAAHTGMPWRVAFGGFAPGFAYLVGGDPRLRVPRRGRPRPWVPAGAVGLAGEFSGVYPRASPGGWQLVGTTDAVLWDVDRDPPALLAPGTSVRFVAVGGTP